MLRTFAIVIAGAAIFASLPLTNARACDDDRYPCPIRSEALIEETDQAPDQVAPDQQQKKSAQPQKKAKAPTNEKAHAKRDREAPRTTASAKVSKPAVREQAPSPRADEQPLNGESQGGSLLSTAGTAWPVSAINEGAADTPAATSINTADAASNAVQLVDPNEVNELDRAAETAQAESSWSTYLLLLLGAALAAASAMWFFLRMASIFARRAANSRMHMSNP